MNKLVPRLFMSLSVAALIASVGSSAYAQEKKADAAKAGATHTCPDGSVRPANELCPILVTARPTRPSAVVELGKILPEIEIAKIKQPFIHKIEEALSGDPF